MRRRLAAGALLAACVTACGSTVSLSGAATGAGLSGAAGAGLGTGGVAAGGGAGATAAGGQPQSAAGVTSGGPTVGGPTVQSGAPTADPTYTPGASSSFGSTSGKLPANSKGVTDTSVKVGYLYLKAAGAVVSAMGAGGYSQGNEPAEIQALVNDQNAHGGLGGRKIQLIVHDLGGVEQSNYQAACIYFSQDNPVFFVLTGLGHIDVLTSCLAKAGVGFSSDYIAPFDRQMRGFGLIFAPDDVSADRVGYFVPRALAASGQFPKGAKVGIYRQETPDWDRLSKDVIRPALAAEGLQVVDEETYNPTDSSGTISGTSGVVLRMHSAGVTHVLSFESPLLLMTTAQQQGWHPFWAITTRDGAGAYLQGAAPKAELANSGGPGWAPSFDLATDRLGPPINAADKHCGDVMRKAGFNLGGTPRAVAWMICGELFHLVHLVSASTELSAAGLAKAAQNLPSYLSPSAFSLSFAGGRHDGANSYRVISFNTQCSCYLYTSPIRPIPTS